MPAKKDTVVPETPAAPVAAAPSAEAVTIAATLREVAASMKSHYKTTDWNDRDAKRWAENVIADLERKADLMDPPSPPAVAEAAEEKKPE